MKKTLLFFIFLAFLAINLRAQDTCASALVITPGTYTVAAINGTEEPPAFCAANGQGTGTRMAEWYSYTATISGAAIVDTNLSANSGGDTRVHVFSGTCGALVCHAGNDDVDGTNYLSYVVFPVVAGETYYIVFDDRWDAGGFDFVLSEDASLSCPSTFPLTENWSSAFGMNCWTFEDANNDDLRWSLNNGNDFNGDGTDDPIVNIFPGANSGGPAKDDWLFSQAFNFDSTHTYDIVVRYNSAQVNFTANESLDIMMLDGASSSANQYDLIGVGGITPQGTFGDTAGNDPISMAYTSTIAFTPPSTGDYHVGIHATTPAGGDVLYVTEVSITDTTAASLNDDILEGISILPSFVDNNFKIVNHGNLDLIKLTISDINGKAIKSIDISDVKNERIIDISNIDSGIYFVRVNSNQKEIIRKIIKK